MYRLKEKKADVKNRYCQLLQGEHVCNVAHDSFNVIRRDHNTQGRVFYSDLFNPTQRPQHTRTCFLFWPV